MSGLDIVHTVTTTQDSMRNALAMALARLAEVTRENSRLRTEIADANEAIVTLREMLERAHS